MSEKFWSKKGINPEQVTYQEVEQAIQLDEQAVAEIQGETYNAFEEEDEDLESLMSDANLRLEQGRLYQMVLQNDIFADTNADPRAIKSVQREIRKHARDRLEILLGIRQQETANPAIVSSPFNDLEVTVLKMLALRASGGKTEEQAPKQLAPPKKDGITAISGRLRNDTTTSITHTNPRPTTNPPKPVQKAQPKQLAKSAISGDAESALKKPIQEMTPEELARHDAEAVARRAKNYAAKPTNLVPHPSQQELEMMYTIQAATRLQQHAQKMELK